MPTALLPHWLRPLELVVASVLLLVSVAISTIQSLDSPWTSVRLAPTFALMRGYPLYSLPNCPPWVMVGYGPFYPVMYLPCIFAHGPVTAVLAGTILAHLFVLVPVGLLCALFCARLGIERKRALESGTLLALLVFGVLLFLVGPLDSVTRRVHVDAPTFGLMLLACFAALRADLPTPARPGFGWTLAAGVFAAMSVCCKINALGSVVALGLYVWWSAGWRRGLGFVLAALVTGGIIYGWAASQNGGAAIVHNFRTLGRFPWSKWQALEFGNTSLEECSRDWREKIFSAGFLTLQAIQTYAITFLGACLLGYVLSRRLTGLTPAAPEVEAPPAAAASATVAEAPADAPAAGSAYRVVGCLLFVTMFGAPASIASVAKYGGVVNGWAFVDLPLSVAAILVLVALLDLAGRTERIVAHGVLGAAVLAVLAGNVLIFLQLRPSQGTAMQEAFRTIKAHPGQCYFASDPLAHLLAGDRFRPNLDTVYSYAVAGLPVDTAVFRAAMPAHLEYLVVSRKMEGWGLNELHRLLPEESVKTDRLNLRFHDAWTKP